MAIDINDTPNRIRYVATASQTVFAVPFEFFDNADIKLYQNATLKTITTHYTLTGANVEGGGNLTLVTGAAAADDILIIRDIAVERQGDFPTSGPFSVSSLNTQLDKMTAMIRDVETRIERRVLRQAVTDLPEQMSDLPARSSRASRFLYFDADGQPSAMTAQAAGLVGLASTTSDGLMSLEDKAILDNIKFATPYDYGVVGDNVADDTAAWQSIVAAINAGDINYVTCRATDIYALTDSIGTVTASNWGVSAEGEGTALFRMHQSAGNKGNFLQLGVRASGDENECRGWTLSGLKFRNDNFFSLTGAEWQLDLHNAGDGRLDRCVFESGLPIRWGGEGYNGGGAWVSDCVLQGNKTLPNAAWLIRYTPGLDAFKVTINARGASVDSTGSWTTATVYAANAAIRTGGEIYYTVAGGTSGATTPVHTSGSVSDGGVIWAHYSSAAHGSFRGLALKPGVGDNIDSIAFYRLLANFPVGDDVPHALEIAYGLDDVGTVTFTSSNFETTALSPVYIHSNDGGTGFGVRIFFNGCRATGILTGAEPVIKIDNSPNDLETSVFWNGGMVLTTLGPALAVTGPVASTKLAVKMQGAAIMCRRAQLGTGVLHPVFEIGCSGVSLLHNTVEGDRPGNPSRFNHAVVFTADVPSFDIRGNDFRDVQQEPYDLSLLTGSWADRHLSDNLTTQGGGVNDDTDWMQALLDAGQSVVLKAGQSYLVTSQLAATVPGTGIEGNGALLIMSTAAGHFDNTTYSSRFATNAVLFKADGVTGAFFRNVKVTLSAYVDPSYLKAVYFTSCTRPEVSGCEFYGFGRGSGIVTLNTCTDMEIEGNIFRDCYSNSLTVDGGSPVSSVQITGVEVDANRVGGVGSSGGFIRRNLFKNLTVGAALRAARGYQTDGINLQGTGLTTAASRLISITDNSFFNLGEAIDCFGNDNLIANNHIERAFGAGVKIIHGACRNLTIGNLILNSGLAGVLLSGSTSSAVDASGNVVRGNIITNVDITGDWTNADGGLSYDYAGAGSVTAWAAFTTAGVRVDVPAAATSDITHAVIEDNVIDAGSTGDYGVFMESTAGGSATNIVRNNQIRNAVTADYLNAGSYFRVMDQPFHRVEQQAARTLANSTAVQTAFGTGTFTAKAGRRLRFKGLIQLSSLSGSANDVGFGFGGTATFTRINFRTVAKKGGGRSSVLALTNFTSVTPTAVTASDVQTGAQIDIEGEVVINAAGTFIPQVQMNGTAGAAATVNAGSYFEITEDIPTTATVGDWS